MFFFDSPKVVLLLKAHSVDIMVNGQISTITFPESEIANQEIVDQQALEKQIATELAKLNLKKQKAILVLSNEIVFSKTVELTPDTKQDKLLQTFIDNIPLDNKYLESKSIVNGNKLVMLAANKAYYGIVKTSFEKSGFSIKGIFPELVFGKFGPEVVLKNFKNFSSISF